MKIRGRNIEMIQFTIFYFTFFRFLIASYGVSLAFFLGEAMLEVTVRDTVTRRDDKSD